MKQTVVFDLDGVIHSYKSGWKGATVIPDEPVPKIRESIEQVKAAGYKVVVVSSRCATPEGKNAVEKYLLDNNIIVDRVCKEKPPAIVYIDDRAICFDGNSEGLLEKIKNFEPWYKKTSSATKLKITLTCPNCGNSTWLKVEDGFECLSCGDIYQTEEMCSEVVSEEF
ncbi:MAG: hypothetical protein UGF89_00835 [Acutalibacteraceae bacterium]|nr:hypothetical protein [Acutalibacteraceae bacterium]